MKNTIMVKCLDGFTIFNNDKQRTISAVIEDDKEYIATLYKRTEEYFAKDSKGREFLVGELDIDGKLVLEKGFELAMEELKVQAIDIFKKYPKNINADLLRRYLKIGLIKANKLIESLEKDGLISGHNKNGKRKLLIR
ncbi:DNA translocase FtsK [Clostridium botulinum]|uniref:DNA translocase FtsK n=1 Tax=Clostridium botulinum TaxID=1491 RepID=UPI00059E17D3|nr:DNA translocase FtsK [Clostridium botulinum]KIN81895.1 hypothetical protein SD74_08150 [Clostridium botulinum]MCC5425553.1 hypothetical protein [Clostridium botulinum]